MANKTNCVKGGKEYYRVVGDYGLKADGSRNRKEFYGKNKKEAEAKKEAYEDSLKSGLASNFDKRLLGELMHEWLFEVVRISSKIRITTFERYEGIYRNYVKCSELNNLKVSELKTITFQRHYNKIYTDGKTSSQIENLNKLLKKFLFYCVDENYLLKNPLQSKSLSIPGKNELKEMNEVDEDLDIVVFTNEEIDKIKNSLKQNRLRLLVLLAIGTGCRLGELLALTWEDIYDGAVHINKSSKYATIIEADGSRKSKFVLLPPKTKSSYRTVPYPTVLESEFNKHKALQAQEKLSAGPLYAKTELGFIFKTSTGLPLDARNIRRAWQRLLNNADVDYKKFHGLRHTFATKLFERDIKPKTVQKLMGHSSLDVTMNIYTHVMPKEKEDAVEVLNSIVSM